jgi:A predicted alpha-helical domain with a conserved ER motif.
VPTKWPGVDVPQGWRSQPAFKGAPPLVPSVARAPVTPSMAPGLDGEDLVPRPVLLRVFLVCDGGDWRAMPGGLGCVLPRGAQGWPVGPVLTKDVWVLAENPAVMEGLASTATPPLAIRRSSGDMPSRVADNFFWLGRYLERLEGAARLLRITIGRLSRPAPTPHEVAELEVLIACLTQAGLLNVDMVAGLGPIGLGQALLRAAASWGSIHALLGRVSRVTALLRDQVTGEMHAVTARGLREVEEALARIDTRGNGQALDVTAQAMSRRRAAVSRPRSPRRARPGGGGSACLHLGVPRGRATAGPGGARAAPGTGAVRFVHHLPRALSRGAATGTGARPAAGR